MNCVDHFLDVLKLRELWTIACRPMVYYAKRSHRLSWYMPNRVAYTRKLGSPGRWEYHDTDFIFHNVPAVLAGMFLSETIPDHPEIKFGLELVKFEEQLASIFPQLEVNVDSDMPNVRFIINPVQDAFWSAVKPSFPTWTARKHFYRYNAGRSLRLTSIGPHDFGAFLWRRND